MQEIFIRLLRAYPTHSKLFSRIARKPLFFLLNLIVLIAEPFFGLGYGSQHRPWFDHCNTCATKRELFASYLKSNRYHLERARHLLCYKLVDVSSSCFLPICCKYGSLGWFLVEEVGKVFLLYIPREVFTVGLT